MLCALPSWAFEVVVNGVKYEVNKQERKAVVVGLADRNSSTMEIQEKVRGYIVSEIKSNAFRNCSLESITIPASASNIGVHAFYNCSSLKSIKMTDSNYSQDYNYSIGDEAFYYCRSLTSINIPSSVTSIGNGAFKDCHSLTSINIPSSVTSIGNEAFSDCRSLASINIPSSVTSIGDRTFDGCRSLTSINIPSSVTSIGGGAFWGCSSLTSITVDESNPIYSSENNVLLSKKDKSLIRAGVGLEKYDIPSWVTSIGNSAFKGCSSLTSINLSSSVTSIGNRAFSDCRSLASINIPSSVTSIGENAFSGCSSLTSINIPSSVTSIGWYAFQNCSSLTSINIPSSVTSIGTAAFEGCSSLTVITVDESNPVYSSENNVLLSKKDKSLIRAGVGLEKYDIPSWVTSIGKYAFECCRSLTSINIPSSVTSIGKYAFECCRSLTSINIPSSVTSIGTAAFEGCSSLTSINIPSSVTSIEYRTFNGCSSLTSINIPSSVTSIGTAAFEGCSSLTSINIPSSVTSIGIYAFSGCSSLTSINIPSSVTSIGEYAFSGCRSLTSINIPSSVAGIGYKAFNGCSNLKTVRFKGKMPPSIGYIFDGISGLKVYVPHGALEAYKNALGGKVNNAEIIEENQSTLYPQALELITPDYTSLIPSNANAKQVAAVQNKADYTANDGLIVDASQLSSNAVEPTEGSLAALIDNDRSTFFHSTWTEMNTTGDLHYLQMDLRAPYKQMVLKYTKRQGYNSGTPVKLHVYATNTPDAADRWEDLGTQTCTYDYESAQTGILPLSLGNGYRYVRLIVEETADNEKVNGNLHFNWSELHAYHRPCKADVLDEAKRSALTTAMAQAKKEMDAGQETSKTTDALQDALTDAENFIRLKKWKAVDFAKSFYLTAYSDKPMAVPTGMQAAVVLADNNGGICTEYWYNAGDVIPAYTGVLLKSGKGNAFHLPIAYTAEDASEFNLLHGTLTDEMTYAEGCDRYYKLSYDFETRSVIGFYWAEDNAAPFLNKAGKAFLALPSDAKVAICGVSLNELAEGATTAIRPITDAPTAPFRAYTLDGRRVNAASQGELKKGFYIINGRKVMVK